MAELTITNAKMFDLAAAFLDENDQPVAIDGIPAWSVADAAVFTLVPSSDGLSAVVTTVGGIATDSEIYCEADADLGAGVRSLRGVFTCTVTSNGAVRVVFTATNVRDR